MTNIFRFGIWVLFACCVSSCSLFSSKNKEKPLPLYQSEVNVRLVWSGTLGTDPVLFENTLWTAHPKGRIVGVDPENGKERFSFKIQDALSTGPLVTPEKIWVGTARGEILALLRSSRHISNRVSLSSEVITTPVLQEGVLVVQTADGMLHAIDTNGGAKLWSSEKQSPVFTLRGAGQPIFYQNQVVAGFANGKLIAFQKNNGQPIWEQRLGVVQGGSELSKLIDIDTSPLLEQNRIYAVAYQGELMALHAETGEILWHHPLAFSRGLVMLDQILVVPDEQGIVRGFDKITGTQLWEQKLLQGREFSLAISTSDFLVVADDEMLFLFSKQGRLVGHLKTSLRQIASLLPYRANQFFAVDHQGQVALYAIARSPS